jgi:hypothetical protein
MAQHAFSSRQGLPSVAHLCGLVCLVLAFPRVGFIGTVAGQDAVPLRVRVEVARGPFYVGEGIELTVGVVGRDQRPQIDLPQVKGAELWSVGTAFKPVTATGIGNVTSGENLFITRLRLLPRRAGVVEVPPIVGRIDTRSGRSRPVRLNVQAVPLEGRPEEFLGGVGEFSVQAEVSPGSVRVGGELTYQIKVTGPAACGMTAQPDLTRLAGLALAPRIEPLPAEFVREPPARTFVYRIRPTRAGEAVLPPVAVAAFDPERSRYITKVTQGLPIKAIAVPAFDSSKVDYTAPDPGRERSATVNLAMAAAILVVALGLFWLAVILRRRWLHEGQSGPMAAQSYASHLARRWIVRSRNGSLPRDAEEIARQAIDALLQYARIGSGRPPGALTPVEAGSVVLQLTQSDELATEATRLVGECDQVLFSERSTGIEAKQLDTDARRLFLALGHVSLHPTTGSVNGPPDRVIE